MEPVDVAQMTAADPVLLDVVDHVATITLNEPDNRNSMSPGILAGVRQAVADVRGDPEVRCVIVTGAGSSFCAGADFKSAGPGDDSRSPHERQYAIYENFLTVADLEVPTIAALNGHAIGGGFGLALVTDIRVADESAKYGANFVRLGMHPGMATTYLLPRLIGMPRAVELLLTGRLVTGAEAAAMGLVNHAVPAAEVSTRAREIATEIATAAPLAVRWTKRSIYEAQRWQPRANAYDEAMLQSRSIETADFREGVRALLNKETPEFKGA